MVKWCAVTITATSAAADSDDWRRYEWIFIDDACAAALFFIRESAILSGFVDESQLGGRFSMSSSS